MSQKEKLTVPDFIIVGAQRCGTTWLHENLRSHPQIYLPEIKELNFFSDISSNKHKGWEWYLSNFSNAPKGAKVGEITPEYFVDNNSPTYIYEKLGKIKIICVLRNPVERAFSSYKKGLREGDWNCSFEDFIKEDKDYSVTRGIYSPQIKRYKEVFGNENVLILSYEELDQEPLGVLKKIYTFISVDEDFISPVAEGAFNIGSSSSPLVKSLISIRGLIYFFPFGKKIFKYFQRTKLGNALMRFLLKSQASDNGIDNLDFYKSFFSDDISELYKVHDLPFVRKWI